MATTLTHPTGPKSLAAALSRESPWKQPHALTWAAPRGGAPRLDAPHRRDSDLHGGRRMQRLEDRKKELEH